MTFAIQFSLVLIFLSCFADSFNARSSRNQCRPCFVSVWSHWSACSASCGPQGVKWRQRRVVRQSSCAANCPFSLRQQISCNRFCYNGGALGGNVCVCKPGYSGVCCQKQKVNGGWSTWGRWGTCTGKCGTGKQSRKRTCTSPSPSNGGADCFGPAAQFRSCLLNKPCVVDGGWSKWGVWGSCIGKCKTGTQSRRRSCTSPPPLNGGKKCQGKRKENRACALKPCKVDGQWSPWGAWDQCSKTCGGGSTVRRRNCTSPPPSNGGKTCCGADKEEKNCNSQLCPVNGAWSPWEAWSDCSKTCGGGNQTRTRACTSPPPSNGGSLCSGTSKDTRDCNRQLCPVDGGWSSWGDWVECSKSCAGGTKWRLRNCTSPPPSNGGACCKGDVIQMEKCNKQACPVNGGWSPWEAWGQCDKTCGGGKQLRVRNCTSPPPSNGGKTCPGNSMEAKECNTMQCPVQGGWTPWGDWTPCDKTCGGGTQRRMRNCTNPAPSNGGDFCKGENDEARKCNNVSCPEIDGGWTSWGAWGRCSVTCGQGFQQRQRFCTKPPPSANGRKCNGSSEQTTRCSLLDCSESVVSPWSQWSQCSQICNGTQIRNRTCLLCGGNCSQPSEETRPCNSSACVVHFDRLGCYKDGKPKAFPTLVINMRNGNGINWHNMNETVYKCGQHAQYAGFTWFALQYFGECWGAEDAGKTYDRHGASDNCWFDVGVGFQGVNFVYKLKP